VIQIHLVQLQKASRHGELIQATILAILGVGDIVENAIIIFVIDVKQRDLKLEFAIRIKNFRMISWKKQSGMKIKEL